MKFQVGDKVKIVNKEISQDSAILLGKICTVKEVNDQYLTVEEEYNDKLFPNGPGGLWFTELELVTDSKPELKKIEPGTGWGFE